MFQNDFIIPNYNSYGLLQKSKIFFAEIVLVMGVLVHEKEDD